MKNTLIPAFVLVGLLLFFSCEKNYFDVFPPDELGAEKTSYEVESEGDSLTVVFLSNKKGTISLQNKDDESWVKLGSDSFESDDTLSVLVLNNPGFKRRADIVFRTDTREEKVALLQKGAIDDSLYFSATSVVAYNGAVEPTSVAARINVPVSSVSIELRFSGSDEWIYDCQLTDSLFSFKTKDNPDRNYKRRAVIALSYVDGWKDVVEYTLTVTQPKSDNSTGTVLSASDLRGLATVAGYVLPEDTLLEGYIVSTTEGGNAGDAVVSDYLLQKGTIDYSLTACTSYLVSLDGKYGFRLIATEESENNFARYSSVRLDIGGAIIKKTSGEPVCYTLEEVRSSNLLSSYDGTDTMPRKEKSITELTDDDINTLVTIKDCEIAMRKGPFTPINEGYSSTFGYNRIAKYPILIRDKKGGSMYMFTNITCPYRRDGETLPYGSGNITGVVVHEIYKSFERNGNIGRYQLRHLTREDIDLKPDFADNYSALITEFRYAKFPDESQTTKLPNAILATKGNGELCHTYGTIGNSAASYFYIGQCGSKYKYKCEEGAGIELDEGGIYQPWVGYEDSQNTDGKGWFASNMKLSWSNKYWWDDSNERGYCWLVNFSTKGITSDMVSMQFAMYNNSQNARSPRYWKAQYSLSDEEWKDIAEFTVPDVALWGTQNDWQTLGTRVYDFRLPLEILDKESVSIRLMPRNNKAAEKSEESYDSSTIANNSGFNTMDYFAVRYNK